LKSKVGQRLEWRRDKVRELSVKGYTVRDIASLLKIPKSTVDKSLELQSWIVDPGSRPYTSVININNTSATHSDNLEFYRTHSAAKAARAYLMLK
jgi:hypothetical protein